jgi:hypothetical protein
LLSKNPLGREICWDYIRANFAQIAEEFGLDDPDIGQMFIDVVSTFEDEFLFYEVSSFI